MNNLPAELSGFPHDLLDKLRNGELSFPQERRALLEQIAGWLPRVGQLAIEAHSGYKARVIEVKRIWAIKYIHNRSKGESVSGAKNAADTSFEYLEKLDIERVDETRWRIFQTYHDDWLEVMNALKIALRHDESEGKYSGTG